MPPILNGAKITALGKVKRSQSLVGTGTVGQNEEGTKMELFKASNQWSTRPPDERFWDLAEMQTKCAEYKASACEAKVKFGEVRVEADHGEVRVVGQVRADERARQRGVHAY